jgi:signal transduction histidine kinase
MNSRRSSGKRDFEKAGNKRHQAAEIIRKLRAEFERARAALEGEARERMRLEALIRGQRATLRRMLAAMSSKLELQEFMDQAVAALADQLGADTLRLWLRDKERDIVYVKSLYHDGVIVPVEQSKLPTERRPIPADSANTWKPMKEGRRPLLIVEDARRDRRIFAPELLLPSDRRAFLSVPMMIEGEVIGWVSIFARDPKQFGREGIELAESLTQQITLTVQAAQLAERGKSSAVLDERNRMAREIHDTLAQGFTAIVLQLEAAEDALGDSAEEARNHLLQARSLARESLDEARRSVLALRPHALDQRDLSAAVAFLASQTVSWSGIEIAYSVLGTPTALSPEVETNLLRIAQEGLANAIEHGKARRVQMELCFADGAVRFRLEDDGKGFAVRSAAGESQGFGLISMRERAERIGGRLRIDSEPGKGTRIDVLVRARTLIRTEA